MNKHLVSYQAVLLLMCALSPASWAQSGNQGSVRGALTDQSGAVVVGARLTAINVYTGLSFVSESGPDGLYLFPLLPVGAYNLRVEKSGFSPLSQEGIQVTVGSKLTLDLKLGVGGTKETVNVTEDAPLVETTRTQVSSTVDANSVGNLPVNGRNFIDFVLLTPGVTRDVRTGDISFGGQRGTLNSLTVDGADDNNTFFGQTTGRTGSGRAPYQFSQDAVQEFQVNSNGYSAELGRAGGAVINVVTKSGTNAFHGTGFEYYRDRGLAANDPIVGLNHAFNPALSLRKPAYHFHQFGGNIGGPIVKNRAFFFFDYDGQRNTQPNLISPLPVVTAPTPFQQQALTYLQARAGDWTRGLNQDTYLLKGDVNISSRNFFSARWNRQNFTGAGFENGGATNSSEHTGASKVKSDSVLGTLTSTIKPTLINVLRFNYQQDNEPGEANSNLPEATVRQAGQVLLTVGRNSFSPRFTNIERRQFADTITWTKGGHTLKAGFDYVHDSIANFFPGNFSGVYSFNSLENFGRSLAGQPLITTAPGAAGDTYSQAFGGPGTSGPTTHPNINEYAWFVQEDWRVNGHLTLDLGLRWDLQDTAKPPLDNPVAAATGIHTGQLNLDTNNFGPRIGFAFTPWAGGGTVVRGGYGIFYGRTPAIMIGTAHSNNGINVQTKSFTGIDVPSYPNTKCGAPVDNPTCAAPTTGTAAAPSIYVMQPGFEEPMVQQANLNLEHEVTRDLSVTVGWQMVKGNHLQRTRDINLGASVPTTFTIQGTGQSVVINRYPTARPISSFARISEFESNANSLYHGLFVQVRKQIAHNFQGMISYTWSHVIDDDPDATAVVPFSSGDDAKMLFDPLCVRCDRASSVNDQRHRFVLSGIWQLSYAKRLPGPARAILGGWEISTIFSAQTGQPYTGRINIDVNNDSNSQTDRAPIFGRNAFSLPATWSLDPRFAKSINFTEHARLQLFVEAFNIFNKFNVYAVRNTQYAVNGTMLVPQRTGVSAFGVPTTAPSGSVANINMDGARVFQLGAKIIF